MNQIPRGPLTLGLLGLIPFVWGALSYLSAELQGWGASVLGPRFVGPYIQIFYGQIILAFMSGALCGYSGRAEGTRANLCYGLSAIPALWAFFMTGGGPVGAGMNLMFGFAGLLILDAAFSGWGLTPPWWMRLRVALTAAVIACLSVGVFL